MTICKSMFSDVLNLLKNRTSNINMYDNMFYINIDDIPDINEINNNMRVTISNNIVNKVKKNVDYLINNLYTLYVKSFQNKVDSYIDQILKKNNIDDLMITDKKLITINDITKSASSKNVDLSEDIKFFINHALKHDIETLYESILDVYLKITKYKFNILKSILYTKYINYIKIFMINEIDINAIDNTTIVSNNIIQALANKIKNYVYDDKEAFMKIMVFLNSISLFMSKLFILIYNTLYNNIITYGYTEYDSGIYNIVLYQLSITLSINIVSEFQDYIINSVLIDDNKLNDLQTLQDIRNKIYELVTNNLSENRIISAMQYIKDTITNSIVINNFNIDPILNDSDYNIIFTHGLYILYDMLLDKKNKNVYDNMSLSNLMLYTFVNNNIDNIDKLLKKNIYNYVYSSASSHSSNNNYVKDSINKLFNTINTHSSEISEKLISGIMTTIDEYYMNDIDNMYKNVELISYLNDAAIDITNNIKNILIKNVSEAIQRLYQSAVLSAKNYIDIYDYTIDDINTIINNVVFEQTQLLTGRILMYIHDSLITSASMVDKEKLHDALYNIYNTKNLNDLIDIIHNHIITDNTLNNLVYNLFDVGLMDDYINTIVNNIYDSIQTSNSIDPKLKTLFIMNKSSIVGEDVITNLLNYTRNLISSEITALKNVIQTDVTNKIVKLIVDVDSMVFNIYNFGGLFKIIHCLTAISFSLFNMMIGNKYLFDFVFNQTTCYCIPDIISDNV